MANSKILCVDDDEKIIKGIERQLGDDFDITTALGPHEALEIFESEGPFAVVLTDMRMPEMNGIQLLKRVREISPNSVRMILTGFAELTTTIDAINEGHIFRFLAKPCNPDDLAAALNAALKQYALVEAEKELVEGTLHGSVQVLSEVLSLVNPLAFGQSNRVRATVDGLLKRVPIEDQWQIEIAAMLSTLGCVTLPGGLLQRKLNGETLEPDDENLFLGHPETAAELLKAIPRLENVARFIRQQHLDTAAGDSVSRESQLIKLAVDFDFLELASESPLHALNVLSDQKDLYDPELWDALDDYVKTERNYECNEVKLDELQEGMVLADDIIDEDGMLVMSKGQQITGSAQRLLENFSQNKSVREPIKVVILVPDSASCASV